MAKRKPVTREPVEAPSPPATPRDPFKAVLVGIYKLSHSFEQAQEYLEELTFLATTAGIEAVKTYSIRMDRPIAATFLGKGKVEELREAAERLGAGTMIFDDDLTPTQVRNLEQGTGTVVVDRAGLILQIFRENARTAQAKAQVELARLEYQLPRLTRMWTHLSRERGGIGLKGAGEQEIETDRRIIREQIAKLKAQLKLIEKQTITRRKNRERVVRVALVGYTNVGKSTLLNLLAKSDVYAENRLFATLDTTVRKVVLDGVPFLLSDTVGFIRKLPHNLVESFRSTLDEVREADVLLHVVDISSAHYIEQMNVVSNTLADMKIGDKPVVMVFNKVDQLADAELEDLRETWLARVHSPAVFISAYKRLGIDALRTTLVGIVREQYESKYPGLPMYSQLYATTVGSPEVGEEIPEEELS